MRFSPGFTTGPGLRLDAWGDDANPCLFFGRNVQLNDYVHIGAIEMSPTHDALPTCPPISARWCRSPSRSDEMCGSGRRYASLPV